MFVFRVREYIVVFVSAVYGSGVHDAVNQPLLWN